MKHNFTIENALSFGWMQTKKNWKTVLLMYAVTIFASMVFAGLIAIIKKSNDTVTAFSALIQLIDYAVSFWLSYNLYKMLLKLIDGHSVKIKEIFHFDNKSPAKIGMYLLANIAYGLVVLVGLVLLIVPGIYFAVKYLYVPYLVLDKDMEIGDAFRKSAEMTKNKKWHLIGYSLVSFLVIIVGLIALIVGVIPASMIITFAGLYIYRKLADGSVHGDAAHATVISEKTV